MGTPLTIRERLSSDPFIDAYCDANPDSSLCAILRQLEQPPFSCVGDLLFSAGNICDLSVDPARLAAATAAFDREANLPPFPKEELIGTLQSTLSSVTSNLIFYQYMPWLVVGLLAIWIMVATCWISWLTGLFLTVGLILILYMLSVLQRSSLRSLVDGAAEELQRETEQYAQKLGESLIRIPRGVLSGICAYTNTDWSCPPSQGVQCAPCRARELSRTQKRV